MLLKYLLSALFCLIADIGILKEQNQYEKKPMLDKWRYLQCGLVPSEDTSRMPLFSTIIPGVTGIKNYESSDQWSRRCRAPP